MTIMLDEGPADEAEQALADKNVVSAASHPPLRWLCAGLFWEPYSTSGKKKNMELLI